jgi:hypothetical protein
VAQTGTDGQWWLDWDREYRAWKAAGIPVAVTYQFLAKEQPPSSWSDPYGISYQMGFKFARHFGKTAGTGTVESFEVGNEPWDYNATFYATVSVLVACALCGFHCILACYYQAMSGATGHVLGTKFYLKGMLQVSSPDQLGALSSQFKSVRHSSWESVGAEALGKFCCCHRR